MALESPDSAGPKVPWLRDSIAFGPGIRGSCSRRRADGSYHPPRERSEHSASSPKLNGLTGGASLPDAAENKRADVGGVIVCADDQSPTSGDGALGTLHRPLRAAPARSPVEPSTCLRASGSRSVYRSMATSAAARHSAHVPPRRPSPSAARSTAAAPSVHLGLAGHRSSGSGAASVVAWAVSCVGHVRTGETTAGGAALRPPTSPEVQAMGWSLPGPAPRLIRLSSPSRSAQRRRRSSASIMSSIRESGEALGCSGSGDTGRWAGLLSQPVNSFRIRSRVRQRSKPRFATVPRGQPRRCHPYRRGFAGAVPALRRR
jgi:hypothetical protein